MASDVKASSEGANWNIWLKVVRSCKEVLSTESEDRSFNEHRLSVWLMSVCLGQIMFHLNEWLSM
jgi:hypothetical protein